MGDVKKETGNNEVRAFIEAVQLLEDAGYVVLPIGSIALRQPDTRMEGGGEVIGYVSETTLAYLKGGTSAVACSIYGAPVSIHSTPLYAAPSFPTVGELEVELAAKAAIMEVIAKGERTMNPEFAGHVKDTLDAARNALSSAQSSIQRAERERDVAQADAYKANKAADAINAALQEVKDRSASHWQAFQALRAEILGNGPMCRDCADENGRCPHSGQPCDPDEAVKEQIINWRAAEAQLEEARKVFNDAFDFLGGVDAADEIREAILPFLASLGEKQDAE